MTYRCDMVKDLMPLCLDYEATEASEQVVIKHLAECQECAKYYEELSKEMVPMGGNEELEDKYVALAKKIRKRNVVLRELSVLIGVVVGIFVFLCLNYASGYRFTSRAAADISGRLNFTSQEIGSYEWKDDLHFYIYDSYSCYDVVAVEKRWRGWKRIDNCLNWPKWSMYDENVGIEMAGQLWHCRYTEGVQLFPIIVYDENVKTVKATCFGETQTKEVKVGELTMITFETVDEQTNKVEATAYDASGEAIYRLEDKMGQWIWVPIEG